MFLSTFWVQADFIEELLRGRLVEEGLTPAMLNAYNWQVFILFSCYIVVKNSRWAPVEIYARIYTIG